MQGVHNCAGGVCRAHKPCDCVHILERGIVMRAAKVLRSRTILGTDFLTSTGSSSAAVVCLTHAMTLTIHKEQYLRVIQDFPDMAAIIRSNVMKDKIREGVRACVCRLLSLLRTRRITLLQQESATPRPVCSCWSTRVPSRKGCRC